MKSKTKIKKQSENKTNSILVETILLAKKNEKWQKIAGILAGPRRVWREVNLSEIEEKSKDGETVVVPGKILSMGELKKKIKVVAFSFSEKAKEKILKSKGEINSIYEEIKKNPEAKGIKILN
jgi:large subunit ribosomal protein L18e